MSAPQNIVFQTWCNCTISNYALWSKVTRVTYIVVQHDHLLAKW